jgi:hypothetical protein
MYVQCNIEMRSRNHFCCGNIISITYWSVCACLRVLACVHVVTGARACVNVHVALLIQHATRSRHVMESFVAPRSPLYFSTLSHKYCDFRKNVTEYKMCVFVFSTTFVYNISHSKKNLMRYRQKSRNVLIQSTRHFCRILTKFEFSRQILKSLRYQV